MLNAYSRVNSGYITRLSEAREQVAKGKQKSSSASSAFRGANIDDILENCLKAKKNRGSSTSYFSRYRENQTFANVTCEMESGTLLSTILRQAAISALNSGKRVMLVGHSLGGALASIMALDILLNVRPSNPPTTKRHKSAKKRKYYRYYSGGEETGKNQANVNNSLINNMLSMSKLSVYAFGSPGNILSIPSTCNITPSILLYLY